MNHLIEPRKYFRPGLGRWITLVLLSLVLATSTGCKKKHLKTLGAIIAVSVAAKIIYDMIIEHRAEQTKDVDQVANQYKRQYKELPDEPTLVNYQTFIEPGSVVNPGHKVSVVSTLEVVPSKHKDAVAIEEKITIYDNQDPTKELKSLIKQVNRDTGKCGAFKNEFTFTLPQGMPQGIYPIKTTVIIDGKEYAPVETKMQLVLLQNERNDAGMLVASH
jgi:hypothetical protein